jgi:hypothetical protein
VLIALVYLVLRRIVRLVAGSPSDLNRDVEMVVLRHQLMVLRRQAGRPRLRRRDRVFMAAISRVLPRPGWSSFVVKPADAPALAPRARPQEVDLPSERHRREAATRRLTFGS